MFSNLLRTTAATLGSAAVVLLLGCATTGASEHDPALYNSSAGTQTVMVGQGGSYAIPIVPPVEQSQPYALTGDRDRSNQPGAVSVYQNYGQAQLVIASPTR